MNLWLIVALIVVVAAYFAVSRIKQGGSSSTPDTVKMDSKGNSLEKESNEIRKKTFEDDTRLFLKYFWKATVQFVFVLVWIFKWIGSVFKEFWGWFRAKNTSSKKKL
jgi:uncharacterized membrane protein